MPTREHSSDLRRDRTNSRVRPMGPTRSSYRFRERAGRPIRNTRLRLGSSRNVRRDPLPARRPLRPIGPDVFRLARAIIPACPILREKRLQPFPIVDLVRHVSIIKTTTYPLLTRRGPSYILYRAVRGRFMTSRLLRWKRSAPTDRQGR